MINGLENRMVLRNGNRKAMDPFGMWTDLDDLFHTLSNDMDRMLWNPSGLEFPRARISRRVNYMQMDMEDRGDNLLLTVEMPGVKKESTKISIDDGVLSISVKAEDEKEEKEEGKYLFRERNSFSSSRCVKLPDDIEEENVSAKMEDGVLHIELPKSHPEEKVIKEIEIE
ncbi:MAG: Hsp20/alpha crystallin family protein [Candidatus Thermoplasmatota archaeon]|nr:Hsp20/alpha crystallin family protein [Candidatus Thermoplasmatota archaeon]